MTAEGALQSDFLTRLEKEINPEDEIVLQRMVHRCVAGDPLYEVHEPNSHIRCVKPNEAPKWQRLGRTGRQRRAQRLSLPNKCRNAKYKRKLKSYDKEAEKSRGSQTDPPEKQHEFWALPQNE